MNHPPIPPKSEYFFKIQNDPYQRNGIWFSLPYIRTFSHDSDFPMLVAPQNGNDGGVSDEDRPIIAAVAEVEWRRRAERWEKIFVINNSDHRARKPVGEHIKVTSHRRYRNWWLWDLSDKQRKICQDNALAWRAWGSTK